MPAKSGDPGTVETVTAGEWLRLLAVHLAIPLVLLACGGDVGWWQAWAYGLLLVAAGVGGRAWAERRHPGLMAERQRARALGAADTKASGVKAAEAKAADVTASDVKAWDKVLAPAMALTLSFPVVIVAGLDHRFGWSPAFPAWLDVAGLVLIALGFAFAAWALAENRFFSTMVRIQTDRGHTVCDSGPYRIVRHPGYAGNLLALPGVVLALGSAWTLVPAALALVVAVLRTELEDRTLQAELPGYRDYANRVGYRLFPGLY